MAPCITYFFGINGCINQSHPFFFLPCAWALWRPTSCSLLATTCTVVYPRPPPPRGSVQASLLLSEVRNQNPFEHCVFCGTARAAVDNLAVLRGILLPLFIYSFLISAHSLSLPKAVFNPPGSYATCRRMICKYDHLISQADGWCDASWNSGG